MTKTILAVDDSKSFRQMVNFTLKLKGFEVIEAQNGEDALTKINGNRIDMVITDLHMAKMNGLALVRKLRTIRNLMFIPIIVMSTETSVTWKQQLKAAGATGWIVKPFRPEKLLAVVRKVLQ